MEMEKRSYLGNGWVSFSLALFPFAPPLVPFFLCNSPSWGPLSPLGEREGEGQEKKGRGAKREKATSVGNELEK